MGGSGPTHGYDIEILMKAIVIRIFGFVLASISQIIFKYNNLL